MLKKSAHSPWDINESDFPQGSKDISEKARFFIRYAILAPNSHNTQPWKFKISDNTVKIFPDFNRALAYSDRMRRELHISLGCALANFCIAANYFGFDTSVEYYPENDLENPAITIQIVEKQLKSKIAELFPYITKRTSNRNPYLPKNISEDVFEDLLQLVSDERDARIDFIRDSGLKQKIISLVDESIHFAFNDTIFKDELSTWVRSNYTRRLDGMPLFGFGVPGPLSILAPFLIKHMPAKMQSLIDKKLLVHSAAFLIISAMDDTRESWIKTGKIYEYITLACLKYEIATSPMAGVVEYDKTGVSLQKLLDIKERPLFFARMGYATIQPPKTPRRDIEDVLLL
jgi:nitroreductase